MFRRSRAEETGGGEMRRGEGGHHEMSPEGRNPSKEISCMPRKRSS